MRRAVALLALLAWPAAARAELALLDNGRVLRVDSVRRDGGGRVVLALRGGGEVAVRPERLVELLPDEVAEPAPPEPAVVDAALAGATGPLERLAVEAARRHGLDPALMLAVVAVESGFQPRAVSPKGALGLMQLMPETAAELGVTDAFDPAANLDGGARHLKELLTRYAGDLSRALAAYNAGVASVERHGGVPPFAETRGYVAAVLERYGAP